MINTAPAVVVRAALNGLGIIRSLGRASVPTIVVDTTRWRAAMWSRFCRTIVVESLDSKVLVAGLLKLQKKLGGRPVLFLTDDEAVRIASECRDELRGAYRFHLPPQQTVAMLSNRARFLEFSEQSGLPVPQSLRLRADCSSEDLSALQFPIIIKPAAGQATIPGGKDHLYPIFSMKEAAVLSRRLLECADEVVVQEWITGPDSNICFAQFHRGRDPDSLRIFTGRKIAGHPAANGTMTLCLPAPEVMNSLEPLTQKFIELTKFEGLGSLEFKWDQRLHRYAIVGLTVGRADWHEELASLSGANIPLAAYRHALGLQPISQPPVDRTVAWRESALLARKVPNLSPNMQIYDGYWRQDDPVPGLFYYAHFGLKWVYQHIIGPMLNKAVELYPSVDRTYQNLVKAIFHRGKASAR
jgi:D-aspartate ligase